MAMPGVDEFVTKLSAGFHLERTGTDGEIADFEFKYLCGGGVITEPFENGGESLADNRLSEFARGVMRATAATFVRWLEYHRALLHWCRRGIAGYLLLKRGQQVVDFARGF